jgi:transposase
MAQEVLHGKDTANEQALYVSFELADKRWKLTFGTRCHGGPARFSVAAGNTTAAEQCIARAKGKFGLSAQAPVFSCYEAGRDGWWLHRGLTKQGVRNIVVDASSIEVQRRRRVKTDRVDGEKLLWLLMRHCAGERRVWSVLHEPTAEQEDARRPSRELGRLTKERTQHTNRIGSLLVLHNLRPPRIRTRAWNAWWDAHRTDLPPLLRAEIEREISRLTLVEQQMHELEAQQRKAVAAGQQPMVAKLATLQAIGLRGASVLVSELFGWRDFTNRRQVGACIGFDATPYSSGDSHTEQGISKSGNKRARTLMVELSWRWLRLQPQSELTAWFTRRFAKAGKRMRRIGIVALARRLAVALWHFVTYGEIPAGAILKPHTA